MVRAALRDDHGTPAGGLACHCRRSSHLIADTSAVVVARLAHDRPARHGQASAQSELGILRRELEKKRRHMPTRRLIEAMPNLLPRLKACFLMSPLSVAQYLDAGLPPFDLVVFDEASQIPAWDALGAMARGTAVVVVGDSRQLPPNTFFETLEGDDAPEPEAAAVEDMESILQECNAAGIPPLRLSWHYRSRHESLIVFSNHHHYDDTLHTFPSPRRRRRPWGSPCAMCGTGSTIAAVPVPTASKPKRWWTMSWHCWSVPTRPGRSAS